MKSFTYTIKDEIGIHARPAGLLAKTAKSFTSDIIIEKNGRAVNATKLMMVMSLGVRYGETVTVSAVGDDEDEALAAMKNFFENNL